MMGQKGWTAALTSMAGMSACAGDVVMTFLLGDSVPGYRPFFQPMSDLGDVGSPVARIASAWWVLMGALFVAFGYGFRRAHRGKTAGAAGWMLALYGIGEGLGSGLAARTPGQPFLAPASIVHNLSGAVGVFSAVLLPFVLMKIYDRQNSPAYYWYSWMTTAAGVFFLALFSIAFLFRPATGWLSLVGLWQRMFMVTYYCYFIALAFRMFISCQTSPAAK